MEEWRSLLEYPGYGISDLGRVESQRTGRTLRTSINRQGVLKVDLWIENFRYTRSVGMLVAETYLDPPQQENFNTLIHLNGDRSDVRARNLMWRPRWFAIKYHRQFELAEFHNNWMRLEDVATGEKLTLKDACMKYGLTFISVAVAVHNREEVYPTGQIFVPG